MKKVIKRNAYRVNKRLTCYPRAGIFAAYNGWSCYVCDHLTESLSNDKLSRTLKQKCTLSLFFILRYVQLLYIWKKKEVAKRATQYFRVGVVKDHFDCRIVLLFARLITDQLSVGSLIRILTCPKIQIGLKLFKAADTVQLLQP